MPTPHKPTTSPARRPRARASQSGVVLIIALIMLVVISLLAVLSMRNATSTEAVSGNVRTTALATQAAEIALRYCEDGVVQQFAPTPTVVITPTMILTPADPPRWNVMTNWDGSTSVSANLVVVIPTSSLGGTVTFNRPPECMIEKMQVVGSDGTVNTTSTYLITARGFGPEVGAADASRSRPQGSESWMQSTIEIE